MSWARLPPTERNSAAASVAVLWIGERMGTSGRPPAARDHGGNRDGRSTPRDRGTGLHDYSAGVNPGAAGDRGLSTALQGFPRQSFLARAVMRRYTPAESVA